MDFKLKKILIFGSTENGAIENFYIEGFRKLNFDCTVFDPHKRINFHSLWTRLNIKLGNLYIFRKLNKNLLDLCDTLKPNCLLVFKGVEIFPETLKKIKKKKICLVNYNPDHPFLRTSSAHGGKNVADCVPLYDYFFSYSKQILAAVPNKKKSWIPFGYHDDFFFTNARNEKKFKLNNKCCFVGTLDKERIEILLFLANSGIKIDVYGPLNKYARQGRLNSNLQFFETIFTKNFWSVLKSYAIQLNFFRVHNIGSHNQRTFEVPAVGGVLLTPFSEEQETFYEDKKEVFFYHSKEGLKNKINEIQGLSFAEISKIREAAIEKTMIAGYSYFDRARQMSEILGEGQIND